MRMPAFSAEIVDDDELSGEEAALTSELADAQRAERAALDHSLNQAFAATFSTAAGREVMAYFEKAIAYAPGFTPSLGYHMGVAAGFARDGQLALLKDIKARIERARNG